MGTTTRLKVCILLIAAITVPAVAAGETYTYDEAGRLSGVQYDDGSFINYSYDGNGNPIATAVGRTELPTAEGQAVTTREDTAVGIVLRGSDPDGDPLIFQVVTEPANGTLSGAAPNLTYTPDPDVNGADAFTFTVGDGTDTSPEATVSITVEAVNDAPVCRDLGITTAVDTDGTTEPDCTDVEGDTLTFAIVASPANGTARVGSLIYTPNPGFTGTDSFTYRANDGTVDGNTATVNVTVAAQGTGSGKGGGGGSFCFVRTLLWQPVGSLQE